MKVLAVLLLGFLLSAPAIASPVRHTTLHISSVKAKTKVKTEVVHGSSNSMTVGMGQLEPTIQPGTSPHTVEHDLTTYTVTGTLEGQAVKLECKEKTRSQQCEDPTLDKGDYKVETKGNTVWFLKADGKRGSKFKVVKNTK